MTLAPRRAPSVMHALQHSVSGISPQAVVGEDPRLSNTFAFRRLKGGSGPTSYISS